MNKLDMETVDITHTNIDKIGKLFPNVIVESENGKVIDFEILKQELSKEIVEGNKEKYQLTWPGKKEAILTANTPTKNTLRPLKEKSVDFDNTENIYIEGDNLEALKILQESYLNKVKCVYIDPPYNTGNDFIYNDKFNKDINTELEESGQVDAEGNRLITNNQSNGRFHSDWLTMIYPRLKLARNLLSQDGVIFISIDDNEVNNLKKICDEIFGESNFVVSVIINRTSEIASESKVSKHEYLLVYVKSINNINLKGQKKFTISRGTVGNKEQTMPEIVFPAGLKCINIKDGIYNSTRKIEGSLENIINLTPIIVEKGKLKKDIILKARWRSSNDMRNFFNNKLKPTKAKISGEIVDIYFENDKFNPQIKKSTYDKISSIYLDNKRGSNDLTALKLNYFSFPKSVTLLQYLFSFVDRNSIILDFFSGSATTAHAVMQLNAAEDGGNRKYIMVQLPEKCDEKSEAYKNGYNNICEIGQERIRRTAKKIKEETNVDIDYGFRVYNIDSSNMKDVYYKPNELKQENLSLFETNIKEDRSNEDLLTQVMLDLGITLDLKIEEKTILNNKVYFVAGNSLVACFDDTINIDIVNEICKIKPLKVVFKDSSFNIDNDKINIFERFKKLYPDAEVRII